MAVIGRRILLRITNSKRFNKYTDTLCLFVCCFFWVCENVVVVFLMNFRATTTTITMSMTRITMMGQMFVRFFAFFLVLLSGLHEWVVEIPKTLISSFFLLCRIDRNAKKTRNVNGTNRFCGNEKVKNWSRRVMDITRRHGHTYSQ